MFDFAPFLDETAWARLLQVPGAVARLRGVILQLAVRGRLVPQDTRDEPAQVLAARIARQRAQMVKEGKLRKSEPLPPVGEDEQPFELPHGWMWTRLGELCFYIQRGKSPSYVDKSDFPVLSQKCVQWSGVQFEHAKFIDPDSVSNYGPERFLIKGDLLWNSTGTGTVGRVALFEPERTKYLQVVADSHVTVLRPQEIAPDFLFLWLASPTIQSQIDSMVSGTTKQVELNLATAIQQAAPLPPLAEQKRIVAKVSELLAQCDALEAGLREAQESGRATWDAIEAQLRAD